MVSITWLLLSFLLQISLLLSIFSKGTVSAAFSVDQENITFITPIGEVLLRVNACITIHSISDIDTVKSQFSIDATVELYWRISPKLLQAMMMQLEQVDDHLNDSSFPLSVSKMNRVWLPDTYFREATDVAMPAIDSPTRSLVIFRVEKNFGGAILRLKVKQRVTVSCPMSFQSFPKDEHLCLVNVQSFAYTTKEGVYMQYMPQNLFRTRPLKYMGPSILLENKVRVGTCRFRPYMADETYTGVCIKFHFERMIFYQFISNFLPAILLVIASFSPYFMNIRSTKDRINISVTLFQALLNVYAKAQQSFPPISYLTHIDAFIISCEIFVIFALIHSVINRRLIDKENKKDKNSEVKKLRRCQQKCEYSHVKKIAKMNLSSTYSRTKQFHDHQRKTGRKTIKRIMIQNYSREWISRNFHQIWKQFTLSKSICLDKIISFLLPFVFLSFNIYYWLYCI